MLSVYINRLLYEIKCFAIHPERDLPEWPVQDSNGQPETIFTETRIVTLIYIYIYIYI